MHIAQHIDGGSIQTPRLPPNPMTHETTKGVYNERVNSFLTNPLVVVCGMGEGLIWPPPLNISKVDFLV